MSRRRKVEAWLGRKPRRIMETVSESDDSEASSGFSSIPAVNVSLVTSYMLNKSESRGTQCSEEDIEFKFKTVATQTSNTQFGFRSF